MKIDGKLDHNLLPDINKNGEDINLSENSCTLQCYTTSPSENFNYEQTKYPQLMGLSEDAKSQSSPDCFHEKINCDRNETAQKSSVHSSTSNNNEFWFKTWPERCINDKYRCNDNLEISTESQSNTQNMKCDNIPKNGISLNEALKCISLAYSPVTKQLHLVESVDEVDHISTQQTHKKLGHKRNNTGSFSSTISTYSEPSTSGSLLDSDEQSLSNFEEFKEGDSKKKKSLSSYFSRWTPTDVQTSVLKLFGKNYCTTQKHLVVGGSTALIQYSRPSNLPCKSQEEEEKHREEYKAILAAVKRKEALSYAQKEQKKKEQLKEEERLANTAKYFMKTVLPNWETMKTNRKTNQLWWQGLPSNIRGKVWSLAIGNELNLTRQLYEICLSRAQEKLKTATQEKLSNEDQEQSLSVIQLDISRTFPHLGIFQDGGPYSDVLHSLLAAYVCYRPDVGYVQGMSYIAAILILNMDSYEAFISFANLLNRPLHLSAFSLNQNKMRAYYSAFDEIFQFNLPNLWEHFTESGLTPDLYLLDWIYTIFAKAMPLDVACRIWDVFIRDGYEFLFRTALGVLSLHKNELLSMDFLDGAQFLTKLPSDISSDSLFQNIQNVSTNIGKINFGQIVEKYMNS